VLGRKKERGGPTEIGGYGVEPKPRRTSSGKQEEKMRGNGSATLA